MAEYIEREAVELFLENLAGGFEYIECGWEYAVEELKEIPAADVAPVRHGKWVHLYGDEWLCNACGFVISTDGSWEHPLHDREKFFCEHCGADMRGGG